MTFLFSRAVYNFFSYLLNVQLSHLSCINNIFTLDEVVIRHFVCYLFSVFLSFFLFYRVSLFKFFLVLYSTSTMY